MRRCVHVLMVIVLSVARDAATQSTSTTDPILPPPDGVISASSTVPVSTTEFVRRDPGT